MVGFTLACWAPAVPSCYLLEGFALGIALLSSSGSIGAGNIVAGGAGFIVWFNGFQHPQYTDCSSTPVRLHFLCSSARQSWLQGIQTSAAGDSEQQVSLWAGECRGPSCQERIMELESGSRAILKVKPLVESRSWAQAGRGRKGWALGGVTPAPLILSQLLYCPHLPPTSSSSTREAPSPAAALSTLEDPKS